MDVTLQPAVEQLRLLRTGTLSARELAEETIRRVQRLNPVLNAFAEFDAERLRAAAALPHAGPLAGLPVSIKSSLEVQGYRCEIGSTLRKGVPAAGDASAVAALRSAGAVFTGTTVCPEFLMSYESANDLHGFVRNPWDLARSAGGSSGGEAAAIAAGLSAGGLGSDSGGSVRVPAHFTGICTLKPTPGRVSAVGHMPPCVGPFSSLGAVGPMARTIEDVTLLFQVLCNAAHDGPEFAPLPFREVSAEDATQHCIAWMDDDAGLPATPETRAAVDTARRELERCGFTLRHHIPNELQEAARLWRIFFLQCGAMFYASTIAGKESGLSGNFREFLAEASIDTPLTSATLLQAWADMDLLRQRFVAAMQQTPLLLTPVCAVPAFRHGERAWQIDGRTVPYWEAMRYTQWFNVLALPAAVVPVGTSPEGLPIGVQIVGMPYQDELVLAVAGTLDETFGYRIPPLDGIASVSISRRLSV